MTDDTQDAMSDRPTAEDAEDAALGALIRSAGALFDVQPLVQPAAEAPLRAALAPGVPLRIIIDIGGPTASVRLLAPLGGDREYVPIREIHLDEIPRQ